MNVSECRNECFVVSYVFFRVALHSDIIFKTHFIQNYSASSLDAEKSFLKTGLAKQVDQHKRIALTKQQALKKSQFF